MSKLFLGSDEKSLTDIELRALHSKPHLHCTEMPGQSSDGKPLTRIASERATTPLAFTADAYSPSNTRTTDKAESDGPQQQMSRSVNENGSLRHIESSARMSLLTD